MKVYKKCALAALVLMLTLMAGLLGCGAPKYKVDYCGSAYCYENARDSYRAGEQVELVFSLVATDTDYRFYLDGEPVDYTYENDAFIITFTMPDHDVTLDFTAVNSMLPIE